jgi:hypothetical protein
MSNDPQAPSAAQWPDASLWPAEDATPLDWAKFYRTYCGWIVVPCAGPMDVLSYARSIHQEACEQYERDHGGWPDEEASVDLWDAAREEADAIAGRPIGYVFKAWMAKVAVASDVTDDMLREAWERSSTAADPGARPTGAGSPSCRTGPPEACRCASSTWTPATAATRTASGACNCLARRPARPAAASTH